MNLKETQISQHMGSPGLGAEVFYLAGAQISAKSIEKERCVCIWKHIC